MEGTCPSCGTVQRGSKNDPFNCAMCGEVLETKDDQFVRFMKSGKDAGTPLEQLRDLAQEAAEKAAEKTEVKSSPSPSGTASSSSAKNKPSSGAVVDVEVL
eukprot:CAMPEP_0197628194 /NCGR_PEP_ID=MMETSP1338-20131121/6589_1 /TAXON_ID=43686 ORGANISM="Pelagodinium beii, Strain RCC1491" /NCGR_SAMPLE_ID=MMETSP1338 /ASSEMBLY_ACC=CAM_ASM_000754 /LENGTH=100 /DNA_ID=CAMNT_0043199133 /DNA_START=447 /DNA_END=749 /DNA_ORIENTATION=+